MTAGLSRVSPGRFCAQVASTAGTGQWYALVLADADDVATVAADITEEISLSLAEGQALPIHQDGSVEVLARKVMESSAPVLVLSGFERLTEKDWASLNFLRSRLLGDHALVFVIDQRSLMLLQSCAPDLDNLLNAATWQLDLKADYLPEKARDRRLEALQSWSGLTDAEVLQKAAAAELPDEPEYAEWLVLLGRGDLLVS